MLVMAEIAIGAFLSASFQVLLEKIVSPYAAKFFSKGKKKKISERLSKLKSTFKGLRAVLIEVENKIIINPLVELWLDDLLDAVDDAEDFFGTINYHAINPKKAKMGFFKQIDTLAKLNRHTETILTRLENLANQIRLGLEKYIVDDVRPSKPLPAKTSLLDESEIIYGRQQDKDALMQLVNSDAVKLGHHKICVIPILGMAGVGKTTLAQTLYNVTQMFQLKAWVSNPDKFDAAVVTEIILQHVDPGSASNHMNSNSLEVTLSQKLWGKRFLIILDNVWDDNHDWWEAVKKPLQYGAEGSIIIVTTRNQKVAVGMGTVDTHHLTVLSEEDCWQVFENYASSINPNIFSQNPMLKIIGRKIADRCNGLPLAAKVLGSLLKSKSDVERWKEVSKKNIWKLRDGSIKSLLDALEVSYDSLPSPMKRCFAYCSIFPKGYRFQREEVVLIWMAANLVEQGDRHIRMEDIGGGYFDDLVSMSLFQLKTETSTSPSYFVMHEFINNLATTVAGKYFCLLECDEDSEFDSKTRHLGCVMQLLFPDGKISNYDIEASRLRTFLSLQNINGDCISKKVVHNFLSKLKRLNVLSFRYYRMTELSGSIGELKHLRYLDLSCTDIEILPNSVVKLYNLQTLKLEDCRKLKALPDDMHHLINLSHLVVTSCERLETLPKKMNSLSSLKTLEISGCRLQSLPEGGLPNSLSKLEVSYHQLLLWEWQTLPHRLSICGNKVWEFSLNSIISSDESFPCEDLLPDTITCLKIKNFSELKSLDRDGLRQLTSLQTLEISNCPNLETLSEDAFPTSLRSLDTWSCPLLKRTYIPNESGIYQIGQVSRVSII